MSEDRDDIDVDDLVDDDPPELDEDPDTGTEDDVSEDDIDEGDDPDVDPEPEPRKPSRGENRVAAATRAAAEARQRAEAVERELNELKARQNQQSDAERQRQRNEHLATLTGDERTDFLLAEQRREFQAAQAKIQFDTWDAQDKAAFAAKAATTPALRGLDAEIEQALATMRAQGTNAPRETVAAYIIGQRAMNKATRANNAGAKRQAAGEARNRTKPSNGRSDVAAPRGRQDKGLEARLANQKL
jgi:hypothetical protein